jgi:hypothetical protein
MRRLLWGLLWGSAAFGTALFFGWGGLMLVLSGWGSNPILFVFGLAYIGLFLAMIWLVGDAIEYTGKHRRMR